MVYDIKPINDGSNFTMNDMGHPSPIPKHPFSLLTVAPKGSGKTTLLANMLTEESFYKGQFDKVIILCPTFHADKKWDYVMKRSVLKKDHKTLEDEPKTANVEKKKDETMISKGDVHTNPDKYIEILRKFRDTCQTTFEEKGKEALPATLLILDDCLGLKILRNMVNFLANSRHFNCSIILSTQRYNSVPPTIRLNTSCLIVYPIWNKHELKLIYEESGPQFTDKEFYQIVRELFEDNKRRRFLVVNNQNPPYWRLNDSFQEWLLRE